MARFWTLAVLAVLMVLGAGRASAQTAMGVEFATLNPSTTQVSGSLCWSNGQDLNCDGTLPPGAGLGVSDSIVSGTQRITVNQTGGMVSLTTAGVDWGYLAPSGFSYLPMLNSGGVSSTGTVSGTGGYFRGNVNIVDASSSSNQQLKITAGGGKGLTLSSALTSGAYNGLTRLGDAGLIFGTQAQNSGTFVLAPWSASATGIRMIANGYVGVGIVTASTPLEVSGTVSATAVVAAAVTQCAGTADVGKMYRNPNGKWATCALR